MFLSNAAIVFVRVLPIIQCYFFASIINVENVIGADLKYFNPDDKTIEPDHHCRRSCVDDEAPRTCHYKFKIESYYAMSDACYNCPFNITDCFRPMCLPADGVGRLVQVVNRQLPGPSIEVCQHDTVVVDVWNSMDAEGTSIHWHGQHVAKEPHMDGVPYVTQCPIPAGSTFSYQFVASTPGTHFWHSHSGTQRSDGVFGALIVRVPQSKDKLREQYEFDEHHMVIYDWAHETSLEKSIAFEHADGNNKAPNLLVNGLGRYDNNANDATDKSKNMPLATFLVDQGFRYRFRLINAESLNCPIEMSIDNHTLYIVSTDGHDIEPVPATSFVSYAGERFDFIVLMNQSVGNYWIRYRGLVDCDERFWSAHQSGILRYRGADNVEPDGKVAYTRVPMKEAGLTVNALNRGTEDPKTKSMPLLQALDARDASIHYPPQHKFYVTYDFYDKDNPRFHQNNPVPGGKGRRRTPQLNHITLKLPSFPLFSQREEVDSRKFCNVNNTPGCERKFCACQHVLPVQLYSVVELIIVDEGFAADANHPFHLHGHHFRVVAMSRVGKNVTMEQVKKLDEDGLIKRNLDRPPIKDTVTVPDGGYTIIRFYANNPGYWLFHCHIEHHLQLGMGLIFKVGEHNQFRPVPLNFPKCNDYKNPVYN